MRDILFGAEPADLDLACALLPEELISLCESEGIAYYPTGLKHQTLTVIPAAGAEPLEITTFRSAGMSPQGGVARGSTIAEDLAYRDFTINAMALDPRSGELIDPFGGAEDFQSGLIRAVGLPGDRFAEDPLRVMRMLRFSAELDFEIESATAGAAAARVEALREVSIERVREEFSKLLLSPNPAKGLRLMARFGVLAIFFPEIQRFVGYEQNRFHKADLFEHTVEVVDKTSPDLINRLAALLHDVGKPDTLSVDERGERHFYRHEHVGAKMAGDILLRMRYPKHLAQAVSCLVATHMRPLSAGPGGVRRLLRDTGEHFERWRELKYADATSCKIGEDEVDGQFAEFEAVLAEVRSGPELSPLKNLAVDGKDLMELGIEEGPAVGDLLRALHEHVMDNPEDNRRDALLALARERMAQG